MNYYQIRFSYDGPFDGFCDDNGANKALLEAENEAERFFTKFGYDYRHAYSWPDGSLYYYMRTKEDVKTIRENFLKFDASSVFPINFYWEDPNKRIYKVGRPSLREYFEQ